MKLNDPSKVLGSLPARLTQLKGQDVVVCKHTWDNVIKLRHLGIKTPAPAGAKEWTYTGRYTPMAHQKSTVEFLVDNERAFVLNDMGTGKTSSALWAAEYLLQQGVIKKVLITCPLSVMNVWQEELFNIVPHRTTTMLGGDRQRKIKLLSSGTNFTVINHDGITTIQPELLKEKFDLIIVDEASIYRNASTKRYRLFRDLAKKSPWLWLMTGTPAPTAPTDVWALIKLVNPAAFPGSFGAFRDATMRKISQFQWAPRAESKELIYKLMKPAIRFAKEDCLDLPPLTFVNRECPMSQEQLSAFKTMKKQYIMERGANQDKITAANAAVVLLKLMQISCGVVKDNDKGSHELNCEPRLELLKECVEESGRKTIVFIPFIGVMNRVKKFLETHGISCEIVNGAVKSERAEIFHQFQHGDLQVLLAHPETTAHGLTLTASSTIVWYGPIFSAEQYSQANARIHRKGQDKPCTVIHIGSTRTEWELYNALWGKIRLQDAILSQYEELMR